MLSKETEVSFMVYPAFKRINLITCISFKLIVKNELVRNRKIPFWGAVKKSTAPRNKVPDDTIQKNSVHKTFITPENIPHNTTAKMQDLIKSEYDSMEYR